MKNVKEILEYTNKGYVDGESGGIVICDLEAAAEARIDGLVETIHRDLGEVIHDDLGKVTSYTGTEEERQEQRVSRLELRVFENKDYKFICIEDTEVYPSAGGTCYSGSVEVFRTVHGSA
jgi:hypothetical protein